MVQEEDIRFQTPGSIDDIESIAEKVHSSMLYLQLELLGVQNTKADHAASHLGKAIGLTQSIISTPAAAARNLSYVPRDIMRKRGVKEAEVLVPPKSADSPVAEAFFDMASAAWVQLERCRRGAEAVPREAVPALIIAHAVEFRLEKLRHLHFDPFQKRLHHPGNRAIIGFRLLKGKFLGKF